MRVGLVDIDRTGRSKFPNLCLMKLSAWHKAKGDTVELIDAASVQSRYFDKIYAACVFTKNHAEAEKLQAMGAIIGGTGWDLMSRLPNKVEMTNPDYSLYGIEDTAYGFLTRGCPRGCPFCIVGAKEGKQSRQEAELSQFWRGQRYIKLLDPNLLACPDHEHLLKQLADSGAWVDFTQGIDARLLNPDNVQLLKGIKTKMIHFAWDSVADEVTPRMLWYYKRATGLNRRRLRCYVLTNYDSTIEEDLYRIYKLREMGYDPYVMIYDKDHAPRQIRRMQRWVNSPVIWATTPRFEDYVA